MANVIENITDAMDPNKHGPREIKVWIAEKIDDKAFLVADEYKTVTVIVENKNILSKKFCGVGNFVKMICPTVSESGDELILTEKSNMIPVRAKGEARFQGKPAPFKPCYDPDQTKPSSAEDAGSSSISKKSDYGSFEVECNKKIGAVSF